MELSLQLKFLPVGLFAICLPARLLEMYRDLLS